MREGQEVGLYHTEYSDRRIRASVVEIQDNVEEFPYTKIVKLRFSHEEQDMEIEGIHHFSQANEGAPFYLMPGERAPKGWADAEPDEEVEVPEAQPVEDENVEEPTPKRKRR